MYVYIYIHNHTINIIKVYKSTNDCKSGTVLLSLEKPASVKILHDYPQVASIRAGPFAALLQTSLDDQNFPQVLQNIAWNPQTDHFLPRVIFQPHFHAHFGNCTESCSDSCWDQTIEAGFRTALAPPSPLRERESNHHQEEFSWSDADRPENDTSKAPPNDV